jgi:hypothetical protein
MPDLIKYLVARHGLDGASLDVLQSLCSKIGPLLINGRHRLIEGTQDAIGNASTLFYG